MAVAVSTYGTMAVAVSTWCKQLIVREWNQDHHCTPAAVASDGHSRYDIGRHSPTALYAPTRDTPLPHPLHLPHPTPSPPSPSTPHSLIPFTFHTPLPATRRQLLRVTDKMKDGGPVVVPTSQRGGASAGPPVRAGVLFSLSTSVCVCPRPSRCVLTVPVLA